MRLSRRAAQDKQIQDGADEEGESSSGNDVGEASRQCRHTMAPQMRQTGDAEEEEGEEEGENDAEAWKCRRQMLQRRKPESPPPTPLPTPLSSFERDRK